MIGGWIPGEGRRDRADRRAADGLLRGRRVRLRGARRHRLHREDARRRCSAPGSHCARDTSPFASRSEAAHARRCSSSRASWPRSSSASGRPMGCMRAPVVQGAARGQGAARRGPGRDRARTPPRAPTRALRRRCSTRSSGCPTARSRSLTDGRRLKISNWDKVLYPEDRVHEGRSDHVLRAGSRRSSLPHLRDRPLTLKRYPNGVEAPYFYEKQSPSHRPEWVQTVQIGDDQLHAGPGPADADLARQPRRHRAAHIAVAGAAARAADDARVRPRSGAARRDRRVLRGRARAPRAVRAARPRERGQDVRLQGPADVRAAEQRTTDYGQTKPFARRVAELLEQRMPELVVSRMTKRLRPGQGARRLEPERRSTRRRSPSTRCGRASARRSRRR